MSFASICYLPRKGIGNTEAFLENLKNFPATHPIIFYSHEWDGLTNLVKLPANVEDRVSADQSGKKSIVHINNLVFYTGLSIAASRGLEYFCYLEVDCRFGEPYWDNILYSEFMAKNPNAVCAGTPVVFNPSGWSAEFGRNFEKMLTDNPNRVMPISVTGSGQLGRKFVPCLFPNGALAIYKTDWLLQQMPEIKDRKAVVLAHKTKLWDFYIGDKMWQCFGEKIWDHFVVLEKQYSGYMNVLTSEEDRQALLSSGKVVAIHQVKSPWKGPQPKPSVPTPKLDNSPDFTPDVSILIVTFKPDLEFLKYALESIDRFATGFSGVTVVVPKQDVKHFKSLCTRYKVTLIGIDEPEGKGFVNHAAAIMSADLYCKSDYVLHMDSDCLFSEPVTPLDYFADNKPILVIRPYISVTDRNHAQWRSRAEKALGFTVPYDGMVRHPSVHPISVYSEVRSHMETVHKTPFREWVLAQENSFPMGFAEFPTLSGYAYKMRPEKYSFINIGNGCEPPNKMLQGWSKKGIHQQIKWKDGNIMSHVERWNDIVGSVEPPVEDVEEVIA